MLVFVLSADMLLFKPGVNDIAWQCVQVPLVPHSNGSEPEERQVVCWEWKGIARDEGAEANAWFTEYLGKPSQLVRFLGAPAS